MKKILNIIVIAATGMALAACATKEIIPEADGFSYSIAIGGETRAVLDSDHMAWQSGDKIGWFTDKAGNSEVNMSATPRSFNVSSNAAMTAGSKVYAYAPYKAGDQSKTAAPLSIPASQDGKTLKDAMPLVSLPIEIASAMPASTATPAGEARFLNLGSVVQYKIYSTKSAYTSEKVESVKMTATSGIAGDFTVDLTKVAMGAAPAPSGLTGKSVTSTLSTPKKAASSKSNALQVYQVIAPGKYSGTVTVETDKASYVYSFSNLQFARNASTPIILNLGSTGVTRTEKGGSGSVEDMLTASQWVLKSVKEMGVGVTTSTGNKLTLNKNHTMSFDCSANGGKTYDHTWVGGFIAPDDYGAVGDMTWETSAGGGKNILTVNNGYLLVFAQEDMTGTYEITELTDSKLTVEIVSYEETWTLSFEASGSTPGPGPGPEPGDIECPYWHTFAEGDWGIGPAFDWGGWTDGYYFDMLTNPATLDGAVWTISDAGYFEWVGTEGWRKGIQLGANSVQVSNFTLSSASFPGTITGVTLGYNAPGNISGLTVSCTVGGSAFGSPVTHGDGDYEAVFSGSASGEIVIKINSPAKCPVYLYYLYIEFTPG